MMMNSELIDNAVNAERGSHLHTVLSGPGRDAAKIQKLYLTVLSRPPDRVESSRLNRILGTYGANQKLMAYQDLFWALLNSNEFIFVH